MCFCCGMEINHNISNPNFGAKLKTISVLESTTGRIIGNNGIEGLRSVILAFPELYGHLKAPGHKGFRFHAMQIGEKIEKKYPNIADASNSIRSIVSQNPTISKFELQKEIQPIIDKLGEELDVVI